MHKVHLLHQITPSAWSGVEGSVSLLITKTDLCSYECPLRPNAAVTLSNKFRNLGNLHYIKVFTLVGANFAFLKLQTNLAKYASDASATRSIVKGDTERSSSVSPCTHVPIRQV